MLRKDTGEEIEENVEVLSARPEEPRGDAFVKVGEQRSWSRHEQRIRATVRSLASTAVDCCLIYAVSECISEHSG